MSHPPPITLSLSIALTPGASVHPGLKLCSFSASPGFSSCRPPMPSSITSTGLLVFAVGASGSPIHEAPICRTCCLPSSSNVSSFLPLSMQLCGSPHDWPIVKTSQFAGSSILVHHALRLLVCDTSDPMITVACTPVASHTSCQSAFLSSNTTFSRTNIISGL